MQRRFFGSLFLLLLLNALVKPVWIFFIDRAVQLQTGDAYGDYFSLLHLVMVPAVITDAGILSFYTKTAAANASRAPQWFRHFFKLKLALAALYLAILVVPALFLFPEQLTTIVLLGLLQMAASFYLFFRAHTTALQLYRPDAFFSVADKLLVILVAGSMLYLPVCSRPVTTTGFILIQLLAYVMAGAAVLLFLWPRLKKNNEQNTPPLPSYTNTLKQTLPYALVVLLMTVVYRFDAFLLYRLHPNGQQEAALYAGGFRLLDALNMIGFLTASFLLPRLGRGGEQKQLAAIIKNSTGLLLLFATLAAAFCWQHKEMVTSLLYGSFYTDGEYTVAASVLGIVGCSLVHVYGTLLTAAGKTRILSFCAAAAALCSITTNLLFIPQYGAFGVAVVAAVIQLLFATALIIACYREQLVTPGKTYWLRVAVFLPVVFLLFRFTGLLYFPIQVIISVAGATGYAFALQLVDRDIFRQYFSRSKPAE